MTEAAGGFSPTQIDVGRRESGFWIAQISFWVGFLMQESF